MDAIGKAPERDITARDLLAVLADHAAQPLLFTYDGATIRPGYHVTEVKTGRFTSLDCGANAEAWTETFIQLWDVDEDGRSHMTAGKFVAIIDKDDNCVARLGDGKGQKKEEFQTGLKDKFTTPHALTVDSKGNLYVLEWVPYGRVRKFAHTPV